jgi:hypothetical protein
MCDLWGMVFHEEFQHSSISLEDFYITPNAKCNLHQQVFFPMVF